MLKAMDKPGKTATEVSTTEQSRHQPYSYWLKRIGLAGFLFYLIKGLLWIIIPALIAKGC